MKSKIKADSTNKGRPSLKQIIRMRVDNDPITKRDDETLLKKWGIRRTKGY